MDVRPAGITGAWVRRCVAATLRAERAGGRAVSVVVTDDRRMRALNRKHLRHDTTTDVVSFEAGEAGGGAYLGDVVVCAPYARRIAASLGIDLKEELARYLVHGTLHLLGYDDLKEPQRSRMHRRQEAVLARALGRRPRGWSDGRT
ncbi:MAG: Endoribonuclease YbeY [Candidatus Omnitrophica bacterium]|nr:Endoribonuclease YbeY [Candidatus Omnitrophota bacterium]